MAEKMQSLNEVVENQKPQGGMQSLNEIVTKRYQLVRNFDEVLKDSYDFGTLEAWIHKNRNDGSTYQIRDASSGTVLYQL